MDTPRSIRSELRQVTRALSFTALLVVTAVSGAHANTLGTLSIQSGNDVDPSGNSDTIFNAAAASNEVTANRTLALQPGDTVASILAREGISADQREAALKALGELYNLEEVKPGDQIELSMRASLDGTQATRLVALQFRPAYKGDIAIVAGSDGAFHRLGAAAQHNARTATLGITTRQGTIRTSLVPDLIAAHVPASVASDVAAAFSYDPETSATPAIGSKFTVVFETTRKTGKVGSGLTHVMRYADLATNGQSHRVYRYETNDGKVAFMEETGRGVLPIELAAPVRNARISSPFGWRIHPVLKVRKFHNGIDFAAPKGTPIYAAEDGVIQTIGWRGNYGRYIKITHNAHIATTYGHMSAFAKGLHTGSHVKKGQVIAYIGSSGLSTGNHLYFEVLVNKKHVDPSQSSVALDVNLDGSSLVRFRTYVARLSEAQLQQP